MRVGVALGAELDEARSRMRRLCSSSAQARKNVDWPDEGERAGGRRRAASGTARRRRLSVAHAAAARVRCRAMSTVARARIPRARRRPTGVEARAALRARRRRWSSERVGVGRPRLRHGRRGGRRAAGRLRRGARCWSTPPPRRSSRPRASCRATPTTLQADLATDGGTDAVRAALQDAPDGGSSPASRCSRTSRTSYPPSTCCSSSAPSALHRRPQRAQRRVLVDREPLRTRRCGARAPFEELRRLLPADHVRLEQVRAARLGDRARRGGRRAAAGRRRAECRPRRLAISCLAFGPARRPARARRRARAGRRGRGAPLRSASAPADLAFWRPGCRSSRARADAGRLPRARPRAVGRGRRGRRARAAAARRPRLRRPPRARAPERTADWGVTAGWSRRARR